MSLAPLLSLIAQARADAMSRAPLVSGPHVTTHPGKDVVNASTEGDFCIPPTVVFSGLDKDMVLLNVETEQYYSLDQVAATIVTRLIAQPFDAAFASLLEDYDVDAKVLRRDIDDLIGELLEAGLVQRVAPR